MNSAKALRSFVAFFSERSISYWTPSSAYFTVSSALPPSRSSSRTTISRLATVQIPFTQSARCRYQETITPRTGIPSIDPEVRRGEFCSPATFGYSGRTYRPASRRREFPTAPVPAPQCASRCVTNALRSAHAQVEARLPRRRTPETAAFDNSDLDPPAGPRHFPRVAGLPGQRCAIGLRLGWANVAG